MEVPECDADNWTPMPRDDDKISEKSQKSQVEDITIAPSRWKKHLKNILRE